MFKLGYRSDLLNDSLSTWLDHFRWLAALAVVMAHLRNLLFPDADGLGPLAKLFLRGDNYDGRLSGNYDGR